jgi:MutS domain V
MERVAGNARVLSFLVAAMLAWLAFGAQSLSPAWPAVAGTLFVASVIWHHRIDRARRHALRAVEFCDRGIDRLEGRWRGKGEGGSRFLEATHPYAADLDLFGPASMFERLCQATTVDGQATLAQWLLSAAPPAEIRARQVAIGELRPQLDLREDLDILGGEARAAIDVEALATWGAEPTLLGAPSARWVAATLSSLALATLVGWLALGWTSALFFVVAIFEIGFAAWFRARVWRILGAVRKKARDLAVLSTLLARLEAERFAAPRLRDLRASLDSAGLPPSARIAQLSRLLERLNWRSNQIFAPVAALLLWATQHAFAVEAWRAASGSAIGRWLKVVGEFEALCSLATYAYENPADPFPDVSNEGPVFEAEGLAHPLLQAEASVRNDVHLGEAVSVLVVSGSNMSGKSTLLRSVGTNAVLAMAGAPVRARRLRLSWLAVGASIRVQDSLEAGYSRFYAEITRLRQLIDIAKQSSPLLFVLDELLQGTNSHDRRLGAEAVVRALLNAGAIGLLTTHDLALTQIAKDLSPRASNVHFQDHLAGDAITFDYRIRPGVVPRGNGLSLMRAVGLPVSDTLGTGFDAPA